MDIVIPELEAPLAHDKVWQQHCTRVLSQCVGLPKNERAAAWSRSRLTLLDQAKTIFPDTNLHRVLIADINFDRLDLSNFIFIRTYFIRVTFKTAKLRNCSFDRAIFRICNLNGADIRGATFTFASIRNCVLLNMKINRKTDLGVGEEEQNDLSSDTEDRIKRDQARRRNKSEPRHIRWMNLITDHGFGIGRFALICILIVVVFGVVYICIGPDSFSGVTASTTRASFLIYSVERFINANTWLAGVTLVSHAVSAAQSLFGVIAVSILTAMITRKLMRP